MNRNGMGPQNQGPLTGRGMGNCEGAEDYCNSAAATGLGRGIGIKRSMSRGMGAGRGAGMGRGRGAGRGMGCGFGRGAGMATAYGVQDQALLDRINALETELGKLKGSSN